MPSVQYSVAEPLLVSLVQDGAVIGRDFITRKVRDVAGKNDKWQHAMEFEQTINRANINK